MRDGYRHSTMYAQVLLYTAVEWNWQLFVHHKVYMVK